MYKYRVQLFFVNTGSRVIIILDNRTRRAKFSNKLQNVYSRTFRFEFALVKRVRKLLVSQRYFFFIAYSIAPLEMKFIVRLVIGQRAVHRPEEEEEEEEEVEKSISFCNDRSAIFRSALFSFDQSLPHDTFDRYLSPIRYA